MSKIEDYNQNLNMALGEHAGRYQPVRAETHKPAVFRTDYERFGPPTTADGFSGILSGSLAEWNKRGLGRAIGYQIKSDSPWEGPIFQGMMFALPFNTEKGFAKRTLLIIPHQEAVDFKVIKPKLTFQGDVEDMALDDQNNLGEYNSLFSPSTIPFALESWKPKSQTSTQNDFLDALLQSHAFVVELNISHKNKERILRTVLALAIKEEAVRVSKDEQIFADLLGEDNVKSLAGIAEFFEGNVGTLERSVNQIFSEGEDQ